MQKLTTEQLDNILGPHASIAIGAIEGDVNSADIFDAEQLLMDYRENVSILFDFLDKAVRAASQPTSHCSGLGAWIPVGERLPEPGVRVWAVLEDIDEPQVARYKPYPEDEPGERQWRAFGSHWYHATHWQPLPAAPTCTTCTIGKEKGGVGK